MQDSSADAGPGESDPATRPWDGEEGSIPRGVATSARLPGVGSPPAAATVSRDLWTDRLWGAGLSVPGGAEELLRLASLLPLTPQVTLLLVGGGTAAGSTLAEARGCYVSAFWPEAAPMPPPKLRKVTAGRLDPAAPAFRAGYHNHAMLLDSTRSGALPDAMLRATAAALKPGGQVVVVDLVAGGQPAGPAEARWIAAEGRAAAPPSEAAMPAALRRNGFDLHVVQDAGPRHRQVVIQAWAALIGGLAHPAARPDAPAARALVAEAEAWLLRLRLLRQGRLRLLRWHATLARRPG